MVALAAAAMLPAAMVSAFVVSPNSMRLGSRATLSLHAATATMSADVGKKRVLVIGGTRFSGLYLTKELHSRGHEVCVLFLVVRLKVTSWPLSLLFVLMFSARM